MNIRAQHKYIKVSPKKLRFVAKSIKGLKPIDAMSKLQLSRTRSAFMLYKSIKSTFYNCFSVYKISADTLSFAELKVDEGVYLRRIRAGARGMARPYHRRSSHITVVLTLSSKKKPVKTAGIVEKQVDTKKKEVKKQDVEKKFKSEKTNKK